VSALPAGTASVAEAVCRRVSSPRFVGRRRELAGLELAPGLTLVAGEPGVGKSRLVAELQARAGGGVLVGHCRDPAAPFAPLVEALGEPLPDAASRPELFEALVDRLDRVVLVVEDLHWADASTRDFLAFAVGAGSLSVVATYRSDELHRRHPLRPLLAELARAPDVQGLELERFSRDEVAEQLAGILDDAADTGLTDRLYARGYGNPLYTEELLAARGEADLLRARYDRLSAPAREVARIAAVAGRPIGGLPTAALLACRHSLLREAIYEDLLPGERTALHAAVARTIAASAAERAWHWHKARDLPRALGASVAAGGEARRLHAPGDALRHFETALALWDRVPDAAERAGMPLAAVLRAAAAAAHDESMPARAMALERAGLGGRRE
jgi:predicted ATPase